MRVFQRVLDNPEEVSKELSSNLPHFKKFYRLPNTDNYMAGLTESMNALGISTMPSPSGAKRRLADIADSSESEEEEPPKKIKKSKKKKKRLENFEEY